MAMRGRQNDQTQPMSNEFVLNVLLANTSRYWWSGFVLAHYFYPEAPAGSNEKGLKRSGAEQDRLQRTLELLSATYPFITRGYGNSIYMYGVDRKLLFQAWQSEKAKTAPPPPTYIELLQAAGMC
jgi:hypothetical protein